MSDSLQLHGLHDQYFMKISYLKYERLIFVIMHISTPNNHYFKNNINVAFLGVSLAFTENILCVLLVLYAQGNVI